MDSILIGHFFLAASFIGMALFFQKKQPDSINPLFGYRTPFSMKNQQVWKEANRFSSQAMWVVAGLLVVFQGFSYWFIGGLESFTASGAFLAVASVGVLPVTEIHLRKMFDQNGQRKNTADNN